MLLYLLAVALGLFTVTEQGKSEWNTAKKHFQPMDNHLRVPHSKSHLTRLDVVCGKDHMNVHMEFDEPFLGVVFSQTTGKKYQRCVHVGPKAGIRQTTFRINYDSCGTTEDLKGQFHENTIIVQFGEDILEAWDEAKRLRCEWLESFEKPSANQQLSISDIDAVELNFQGDDIDCWMEIQQGKGPWARQVGGLVPLGSTLTVVIAINDKSKQFDMRVKKCDAHDETGSTVQLTDDNGCVLRSTLLTPFVKVRDFSTKATLIAYSHLHAFKFPDHLDVYVRCTVEICRHGCVESCPGHSSSNSIPRPRKPSLTEPLSVKQTTIHLVHLSDKNAQPGRIKDTLPNYKEKSKVTRIPHFETQAYQNKKSENHHKPTSADNSLLKLLQKIQNAELAMKQDKLPSQSMQPIASKPISSFYDPRTKEVLTLQEEDDSRYQNKHFHKKPAFEQFNAPAPEPFSAVHLDHIAERIKQSQKTSGPQPEPNSFEHPHHITTEQLQHNNRPPEPEPNSFTPLQRFTDDRTRSGPEPEPNSFAHPHHITTEQLKHQYFKKESESNIFTSPKPVENNPFNHNTQPQPEPNTFAHPHHITKEELHQRLKGNLEPQPEPNSFVHPHHIITTEKINHGNPEPEPNSFIPIEPFQETEFSPGAQPEPNYFIPIQTYTENQFKPGAQPEPNSFAHPHHVTTEFQQRLKVDTQPKPEPNSYAHPHHITTEELQHRLNPNPQPEPNSFAHPHHITTEQLHHGNSGPHPEHDTYHQFVGAEQVQHDVKAVPPQPTKKLAILQSVPFKQLEQARKGLTDLDASASQSRQNTFAHHLSEEQFSQQSQAGADKPQSNTLINSNYKEQFHQAAHGSVISVTLVPRGEPVLRYTTPEPTTMPQPVYIPKASINNSYMNLHNNQKPDSEVKGLLALPTNNYPVPQFSPRQQQVMLNVPADRRIDGEDIATHNENVRQPITSFLSAFQHNVTGIGDVYSSRSAHGPRVLRVKRSEPVFGVQQKFRAIAPADLAFEFDSISDDTTLYKGRREEIIYGVCMSPAKLTVSLGLMLFFTVCSMIAASVLFQRGQVLEKMKKRKMPSTSATLFNGQAERIYRPATSSE